MTGRNVIDLFCGAGGFSVGFKNSDFDVLAGVDNNDKAIETFEENHDALGYNIDLSSVSPSSLLTEIGIDDKSVDGIVGGPPCQGFSQAGDRNPDDDRNKLVKNYFDIIEEIEPKFFVMENVRAITYERNSETIEFIENRIESLGYNYDRDVLNAANFGVPQTRKRLFILGYKNGEPSLPVSENSSEDWTGLNEAIDVPDGQIVSSYGTQETLRGERNTRHVSQPSYTLRATRCLVDIIPSDYTPPESTDIPSITDVRIYRFDEEDASLVQSFPENYEFAGNLTEQRSQIGNAVPPNVSEAIAKEVNKSLYD